MTDKTDSKEREAFETWVVTEFPSIDLTREGDGYYKSLADEWWTAFQAGRASLAASAGSEPVAYAMFADNGNIRLWSKARIPHPDAKPLYLHPSPPEGMVGGWIASKDQMPPPGVRVFWGDVDSNRVGYDFWAGDDYRWTPSHWMHIPEFPAPPTTSAGSGKGE